MIFNKESLFFSLFHGRPLRGIFFFLGHQSGRFAAIFSFQVYGLGAFIRNGTMNLSSLSIYLEARTKLHEKRLREIIRLMSIL